jgi:protein-S-isoprenylcysteine O-methyltransferase Ste14
MTRCARRSLPASGARHRHAFHNLLTRECEHSHRRKAAGLRDCEDRPCERLALILLFWQWRPIPSIVWEATNSALAMVLLCLSMAGWFIVLLSTFLINHFELFGLQQVIINLAEKAKPPRFRTPMLYKFVRHPLYLGFIIAFWAAPMMTVGHLLFAVVTTAYIFVGIALEERDLIELFGDEYRRYRQRVAMILPVRWKSS